MRSACRPFTARITCAIIAAGCATDPGAPSTDDDGGIASGGAGATTSSGGGSSGGPGGGGAAQGCVIDDPCETYDTREACCADPDCGWHHNTGHSIQDVPPCVSQTRICVVAGEEVAACAAGTTCLREGVAQDTANDCTLPPDGMVSLLDRGICVCE